MPDYKQYNNYSEQDKDSMRTDADIKSNQNEQTLISQTDQVESLLSNVKSLLGDVKTALGTVNDNLVTLQGKTDTTNNGLTTIAGKIDTTNKGITAIQGKQDAAKGVLDTIATNTAPAV